MNKIKLKEEYYKHKNEYINLQREVLNFVKNIQKETSSTIDIADVKARKGIKLRKDILGNIENPDKNTNYKNIFDIKDIAGIRVTCHCEDDVDNITTILQGKIKEIYDVVPEIEEKGEDNKGKSNPAYRAKHITFIKKINGNNLCCEIQIRTVMADAWAVQDRKYIYGKILEGDAKEITNAAAQIMTGCEQLWSLVKKKSIEQEEKPKLGKEYKEYFEEKLTFKETTDLGQNHYRENAIQDIDKSISWFQSNEKTASEGLKKLNIQSFMEVKINIISSVLKIDLKDLNNYAKESTIKTFGRPIGIYIDKEGLSPKPDSDGIHAEISMEDKMLYSTEGKESSYDYWALNKNGSFYLKTSLFEDSRKPNQIFFDTRIIRITEVLMYIKNLYSFFGISNDTKFLITIKHGGLKGRILGSASRNRSLFGERRIETNEIHTTIETTLSQIETNIVDIVESFTDSLFEQFEFFKLNKDVLKDIVINYTNGKIV